MAITGNLDRWATQFPDSFVPRIVKLVLESNKTFKIPTKKPNTKLEDHITRLFCSHLRKHKDHSKHFFLINHQFDVLDNDGNVVGRIDLVFNHGHDEKVYYSFECKVLRVKRSSGKFAALYSQYVTEGIYRYFNGQYAQGLNKGGMLGYVMDSDVDKAVNGVRDAIENRRNELNMNANDTLGPSSESNSKLVKETVHKFGPGNRFLIYHIFLPMTPPDIN
ncbi:MAG: hypothetical protein KAS23_01950 [Anaerohalosphaera sp.]|nr:hypothetical protein [Anaerohalosphaera sp.]